MLAGGVGGDSDNWVPVGPGSQSPPSPVALVVVLWDPLAEALGLRCGHADPGVAADLLRFLGGDPAAFRSGALGLNV